MNYHRLLLTTVGVGMLLLASGQMLAQRERPTQPFMRQKLIYAQGLLEGVTLDKFELIITNAAALRDMSQSNAFLILQNPDYMQRITNFQVSVDRLSAAAKSKDGMAALSAYKKVTENCVDCHRYFRREQRVQFGNADRAKRTQ